MKEKKNIRCYREKTRLTTIITMIIMNKENRSQHRQKVFTTSTEKLERERKRGEREREREREKVIKGKD